MPTNAMIKFLWPKVQERGMDSLEKSWRHMHLLSPLPIRDLPALPISIHAKVLLTLASPRASQAHLARSSRHQQVKRRAQSTCLSTIHSAAPPTTKASLLRTRLWKRGPRDDELRFAPANDSSVYGFAHPLTIFVLVPFPKIRLTGQISCNEN
ncbi:uncharacterized protein MYCFIDRAFT_178095 [Pseudocercospora fijiensis CIRAD86]|uniref:Uncharacterized protein n=1 Tax=Pseudocercospora fijiensis (strain CIRAD86) TaxID=383855 RepID=M2ZK75_PSEFD|nr:uncharacterized protein MYCFIDRAFT_178095 [Pseudocercospora fijiensis CIRAD86]EME79504.1 hypothetical protein MYCFIDRAFT_178095 [Pseudocercospora fijiensis CIRAD86]